MLRMIVVASLVLVSIAGVSAVQAAPLKHNTTPMAIDRFVDIFRPWELVGPPVDPTGPLTRFGVVSQVQLHAEPEPWRVVKLQATTTH